MGIRNRDGALYSATGIDNTGLYAGRREAIGIIKAMASEITSFDVFSGIGISAATVFAKAAKSSYDFEKEFHKNMLEVATISTQVTNDMTGFMNQVMSITQEIPVTAPEAAKALYQIVSAGHDGAAGMKVLEVSARSAIGGMTDTATAADAITTLLNAYKLSADDAEKVSDQLFTTARLGKTTFGELGQSIAQVAPIAASYGVEMDQVLAAVATLTKSGTPTAQAMTQIRASIIGTSKVLGDGAFNTRTFQEALGEVATMAGGSESKLRELIPEVEAVNGVLGMTGIKAQDAAEHLKAMNESAGSTEAAFKLMMNDVDKQMTLLSNNIQAVLRPMGQAILKEVQEVATAFNEAFENGDAERVIKSLGDLVLILAGAVVTYKGAILASTAAQRINVAILRQTVLERKMENMAVLNGVVGHQKLTTAQLKAVATRKMLTSAVKVHTTAMLKNVAAMATNPYVLAAAALTTLGVVLYQNVLKATEAEKAQSRLNDAIKEAEKGALSEQRELAKLKGELSATTKGTDEYNKIRDIIVSNYGKYDKNLKDEIDRVGLLDTTYQNLTKSIQQSFNVRQYDKFKQEQGTALDDVMSDNLDSMYDKLVGKWGDEVGAKYYTEIKNALMAGEEIPKHLNNVVSNMYGIWAQSLHGYINNIREAQKATEDADKKARVKFGIEDGSANGGGSNSEDGKNDGTKKDLSSVSEEIKTVTANISSLKKEIEDFRNGKTSAEAGKTVQAAIEEKMKELKTAEDALATLTGKDKSSLKEASDLLKLQSELSRSILDSELKLQSGRIAAMEDGKAKRIALAEQETKDTIAAIQKEKAEYHAKVKESKGKEDPTVIKTFDNRELAAKEKEKADIARIEKEYAEEYKQRTKALTDVFLNEEERKLSAVKTRYDEERKWADQQLKTGGMTKDEHKSYTTDIDKAQQQETYRSLLDNLNDYKQQEKDLRDKWDTDIAVAVESKDAYLVAKLMEGKQKALSALNSQMLQESADWMRLFGNLDTLTVDELNKLIDTIQKQLDSGTLVLKPVDAKALMDSLNQAKEKVAEKNPFAALSKSSEEMKQALANLKKAEEDGLSGEQLDEYKRKVKDAAENVKKSITAIKNVYGQVSEVMKSVAELIGMVDEGLGETVNNTIALGDAVMNVGEVVANAVIAFAAGMNAMESASVILLVIKAVIMAVMAAISLFNGDKKHEKKIKNLQEQVDDLSRAYNRLGEAIEDAYSTNKADLIDKESENLRQQNELIQQQIKEEEDKKKTDKDKVKDWQNTIEDNNRKIEENSKKGRVEAIMGSDIKSAIDEFAQAYADAWAKGEKAAGKSADIVKSLIRTSIIEMLKKDLKPEVEAFMTFLSGAMADGIIDASEQQIIDNWEKKLEGIADSSLAGKEKWLKDDDSLVSSDSLSDTIIDELRNGKSGIKDFAGSFEDMMRDAVLNSLKTKYLEGPLKEFSKKFTELSESGGQLTEAEIEELRNMYADIIDGAKVQFDGLKEISGLDFSLDSDNTLKGAYAKASQESIDLLAGQAGAQRVVMEDIKNNMQPIREQLQFIHDLQREGWQEVKAIRELTTKIDKNTEQVASNTRMIHEVASKVADNTRNTVDALEGTINVKIKGM